MERDTCVAAVLRVSEDSTFLLKAGLLLNLYTFYTCFLQAQVSSYCSNHSHRPTVSLIPGTSKALQLATVVGWFISPRMLLGMTSKQGGI